jgi:hypothetical protein
MFHYEDYTLELEQEDRVETALIGVHYTGTKSSVSPNQLRQQAGWPGTQPLQGGSPVERDAEGRVIEREPGPIQIALNPDWIGDGVEGGTLTGVEANPDFEVIYDPARLAEAMLEANYLPTDIFGSPPDQEPERRATPEFEVRQAVFDALGLEDVGSGPGSHEEYREQLAEIAGVDLTGEDDSPVDDARAQEYIDEHTRSDLADAVEILHPEVDPDLTGKLELTEWLAKQPAGDVRAALEGDVTEVERESEGEGEGEGLDESGEGNLSWDPADHTVDELRDHVESIDGSNIVQKLEALREAEVTGKNRKTAKEAIDARLDDVRSPADA